MKQHLFSLLVMLAPLCAAAQTSQLYDEAPNPVAPDAAQWSRLSRPQIGWGSINTRYKQEEPVPAGRRSVSLTAWRGEKVAAQAVVSTPVELKNLTLSIGELASGSATIGRDCLQAAFVRYVFTDEPNKDGRGACGHRVSSDYDSSLVADVIDHLTPALDLPAQSSRSIWVSVAVPADAQPGNYSGTLQLLCDGEPLAELALRVRVQSRTLPPPSQWSFHLDLWQNPYAVARYHGVAPFSDEHLALMRPLMKLYADAGGKVITASIIHKPWNGQTYDPFESMVTWLRRADGSWLFDYTVFDRWVETMMSLGVTREINCYSMVPWRLSFQYLDQGSNTFKYLEAKPGEAAYEEFWVAMLTDFARHLRQKGWFGITHIAMDERPKKDMIETLKVIRKADKDFKVSLAGNYHAELAGELDDYCISLAEQFPPQVLAERRAAGRISTCYTCCAEARPNTFTFSPPAEAEWLPLHCAQQNLDGYLRWALNSWVKEPLIDSRFVTWGAGDTYLIYPDARSSIRLERLAAGIQTFEKIRILREEFERTGRRAALDKIEKALRPFATYRPDELSPQKALERLHGVIDGF